MVDTPRTVRPRALPLAYRRGVHDIAGLVALAIVGLWIAYLVPHRLRYRQQLLESRTEDRFSDALRVLAVTDPRGPARRAAEARAECGPDSPKRSGLLSPARGVPATGRQAVTERKGGVVERPYGTQDKITADAARRQAQLRARRAAAVSRRAAAAKRRSVLTVALLVVSAAAWVVVGLTSLTVAAAVVPSVLLLGVLGLGRRAVVQARVADAAWEQQQRRLQSELSRPASGSTRITGRALHPSDSHTEAVPHVAPRGADAAATTGSLSAQATATGSTAVDTATAAPEASDDAGRATTSSDDADPVPGPSADTTDAQRDGASSVDAGPTASADDEGSAPAGDVERTVTDAAADGETAAGWSPVPVPRPTYTTKATAPRREPLPLVVEEPTAAPAAAVDAGTQDSEVAVSTPPAIDLDAVLARRRAVGE